MELVDFLIKTVLGLLLMMSGFATAGFISSWSGTLAGSCSVILGVSLLFWGKQSR